MDVKGKSLLEKDRKYRSKRKKTNLRRLLLPWPDKSGEEKERQTQLDMLLGEGKKQFARIDRKGKSKRKKINLRGKLLAQTDESGENRRQTQLDMF